MKYTFVFFFICAVLIGCGDDMVPLKVPSSDLTRSGKFISFTSNLMGNYDIFLAQVNSSGQLESSNLIYPSNPFNLTASNATDDKQSNWSPDGRILVYARTNGGSQEVYAMFFKEDGSKDSSLSENPKQLFSSNNTWDNNPFFSPDGSNLIWDRREDNNTVPGIDLGDSRDLFIADISGYGDSIHVSNIRKIINTVPEDEYNAKWSPRISVGRIAYEYQSSPTATDHDVWIIDPDNTFNKVRFYEPNNSGYPAWSPACDRIIFESDKSSGDFWKIVSMAYPTNNNIPSDIAAIPNVHLRYPTWLPNGKLVSYVRLTGSIGNIWIIPSNGGAAFQLIPTPSQFDAVDNLWPAW